MIPYGRQSINEDDIRAVISALQSDWLTTGPLVEKFESALEEVVGAPCVSVSSGTAALHCAYAAIGLEEGDEVITPPITFIATQATAAFFGAKIVFADVQPDTANLDPDAVAAAITSKTKAIVAVDFAGHPAELKELRSIADKNSLVLIEDAAHSIGSIYRGKPVGSIADVTTFSFFPTKNMTTAEGGAVASTNPEFLLKAKRFSRQGMIRETKEFILKNEGPWHQEVHEFGLNYRLPDVLCALGMSQLSRLQDFKLKRESIYQEYERLLGNQSRILLPTKRDYVEPNWHLYPVRVNPSHRRLIFEHLREKGIGVQVNYLPAHKHPVFNCETSTFGNLFNSENYYSSEISLPIHTHLSIEDLEYISRTLIEISDQF